MGMCLLSATCASAKDQLLPYEAELILLSGNRDDDPGPWEEKGRILVKLKSINHCDN